MPAHLLWLDAGAFKDHQEELGGQLTLKKAAAAEAVQQHEHQLCVLCHTQGFVEGLCPGKGGKFL